MCLSFTKIIYWWPKIKASGTNSNFRGLLGGGVKIPFIAIHILILFPKRFCSALLDWQATGCQLCLFVSLYAWKLQPQSQPGSDIRVVNGPGGTPGIESSLRAPGSNVWSPSPWDISISAHAGRLAKNSLGCISCQRWYCYAVILSNELRN